MVVWKVLPLKLLEQSSSFGSSLLQAYVEMGDL